MRSLKASGLEFQDRYDKLNFAVCVVNYGISNTVVLENTTVYHTDSDVIKTMPVVANVSWDSRIE